MRAFSTLAAVWAAASAVLAAPLAAPAPQELTLTPSVDGSDVGIKKAGTPDTKFSISSFDLPDIYNISTIFSLTVGGQKIPVVSNTDYEYARFAMPVPSSPVLVEIQTMSGLLPKSATVSPRKFGIPAWVSGNKVSFKLNGRYYLIVKISDRKELVIMIDGPETDTKPSSTGKNIFNIKDAKYKPAKANDPVSQTQAFQKALDDATAAWKQGQPQSVVYVPAGVYDVGNLILKSNTALYLESGAALRFYGKDSKKAYYKGSQGRWVTWWISTAFDSENISVYGRGVLDANGVQSIADWKMGNNVLVPIQTKNFKFDGLILTNSAAWSFTPIRCDGVEISNVKIMNRQWQKGMGENDGIDVMHSKNVYIHRGIGISLDDPWSTKTWANGTDIAKDWPRGPHGTIENVRFEDLVSWTVCYGFKVGAGIYEDQKNITFTKGYVYDAAFGLGIDHRDGAAVASNIVFDNIDIENLSFKNMNWSAWETLMLTENDGTKKINPNRQAIKDVTIKNINVRKDSQTNAPLIGWDDKHRVSGVSFSNIIMPGKKEPAKTLDDLKIHASSRWQYEDIKIDDKKVG